MPVVCEVPPSPIHNGHRCKAIPEALADEKRMISRDLLEEGRSVVASS
jgi:hypothetical protein